MSLGSWSSAPMGGRGSNRWTTSKPTASSRRRTAFVFFGLVFFVPGVVGANLPAGFATYAAYGDFATGILAMLALLTVRIRLVFWLLVVVFNTVGAVDLLIAYYHGNELGLPALAGELGAAYAIPIIYVPALMITHVVAFYLLLRARPTADRALVHRAAL